jgi:hypothetical protein
MRGLAAGFAVLWFGCSDESVLFVDVATDLVPGFEFTDVRTELASDAPGSSTRTAQIAVRESDDFIVGRRVAELEDLPVGSARVRVTLLARDGTTIVAGERTVAISGPTAVVIALGRSCRGIACPGPIDDLSATTCRGGRCVTPSCEGSACAPECDSDEQCSTTIGCARAYCESGACFVAGRNEDCSADEYCDPDEGCVRRDGSGDAGPPCAMTETECGDERDDDCDGDTDCDDPDCEALPCDDGDPETMDVCAEGECVGMPSCDDRQDCTTDSFDGMACVHTPVTGTCDDGVFCNGADACSGGLCSMHPTPACPANCDEMARACRECYAVRDSSCAAGGVCCAGHSCREGASFSARCCAENGTACGDGEDCCGDMNCMSGTCRCVGVTGTCRDDRDCCAGNCDAGFCR